MLKVSDLVESLKLQVSEMPPISSFREEEEGRVPEWSSETVLCLGDRGDIA